MNAVQVISSPNDVLLAWDQRIALRDGLTLGATVYRPRDACPAPAIVTMTPYIAQTYHDVALRFAQAGLPFVTVDVRGRGNSDGEFAPFMHEAEDGHDVVEWIARQPWCDGQVAMWGGSYAGYNQWRTVTARPPHLAAIAPVAAPIVGIDFPMRANIPSPYLMQWLTFVAGRASQDRIFGDQGFWKARLRQWFESGTAFADLDSFLGLPSPLFQEWISQPEQGPYWDRLNPSADAYRAIDIPILTITGIYDGDQPGALGHYRQHMADGLATATAEHHLVIGPWDHAGTRSPTPTFGGLTLGSASVVDLVDLHVQWYRWRMAGGPRPAFLRDKVVYYVLGAERWCSAPSLDAITARHAFLHLGSDGVADSIFHSGMLLPAAAPEGSVAYRHDPSDIAIAAREASSDAPLSGRPIFPLDDYRDQAMLIAREGRQFVFHSAPFEQDVEIAGFFELEAWIAIDQPDTDFCVSVFAIDGDGTSLLLTADYTRARYRRDPRKAELVSTTEPLRYLFDGFTFTACRLRRGARLRLVLAPPHSIYTQKNYQSGKPVAEETVADARTVTVRLHHRADMPSRLKVPFAAGEDAADV